MEKDEKEKTNIIEQFNENQKEQIRLWKFKSSVDRSLFRYISTSYSRIVLKVPHRKLPTSISDQVKGFRVYSILIEKDTTTVVFKEKSKHKNYIFRKRLKVRKQQKTSEVVRFSYDQLECSISYPLNTQQL